MDVKRKSTSNQSEEGQDGVDLQTKLLPNKEDEHDDFKSVSHRTNNQVPCNKEQSSDCKSLDSPQNFKEDEQGDFGSGSHKGRRVEVPEKKRMNKKLERTALKEAEKKMTEAKEESTRLKRDLEEVDNKKTEAEEEITRLKRDLLEVDGKMTEAEEEITRLKRALEEVDNKKTEAEEEITRLRRALEKNLGYYLASVLLLVSLCIGLHLAFKGPEINHHELRLMLVGKTGAGKSASGNTILGEEAFRVEASPASVTASCKKKSKVLDGRNVTIIDTPGVMDTWLISDQTADHTHECISMFSPDPHMFLLVIKLGRFTVEEMNAVKWIQENFGEEALKFTMILFTGGDLLEGKPVEKFISNSYDLQNLVDTCDGRYHVFNNYEPSDHTQVKELFEKINSILHKNMGYFYTKEVHQKVQQQLENEMKLEERRKMNEMAKKLRDEQYENKNLNAKLEQAYQTSNSFMGLTIGLILIAVCVKILN